LRLAQGQVRNVLADYPVIAAEADQRQGPEEGPGAMAAMMKMKKIDMAALQKAYDEA
jgi:predicted 3-demethylubiquinone-9 3-methyltransferase (glyoxalase superfamily)